MKVEYFPRKLGIFHREIRSYLRTVFSRAIEKFIGVKPLDGLVLCIDCIQDWHVLLECIHQIRNLAAWKHLRIVKKGRTFS